MIECTRILGFDAAHRVMGHANKCNNLHGHRYNVEATFRAKSLDHLGMVIDFAIIKKILGDWINTYWDHTVILFDQDKELGLNIESITKQKIFYMSSNPTAENMALYLLKEVCPMIFKDHNVVCTRVKLDESPNCYTVASL